MSLSHKIKYLTKGNWAESEKCLLEKDVREAVKELIVQLNRHSVSPDHAQQLVDLLYPIFGEKLV